MPHRRIRNAFATMSIFPPLISLARMVTYLIG
jgi:hypothetical protein